MSPSLQRKCPWFVLWLMLISAVATAQSSPPASANVGAQNSDCESLYVTATVWERVLSSATSSVTVMDRAQIEKIGAQTLVDLLPYVAGINLVTTGARGGLSTAQMRGGDPNFTLVLLDGVPLNDSSYQVGDVFDLAGLSLHAVERVEVVRGPLSSHFGATGLAGVINLITSDQPTTRVSMRAGNGDHVGAQAALGGSVGNGKFGLSLSHEEESELIAEETFRHFSVRGNLSLPLQHNQMLKLHLRHSDWKSDDYPDASGGPLFGSGLLRQSLHRETSLSAAWHWGGRHKLEASLYRHDMERQSPAIFPLVPQSQEDTSFNNMRLAWRATFWRKGRLQVDGGADLLREEADNHSQLLLPPFLGGDQAGDYALTRDRGGAFAAATYSGNSWVLELSSRIDAVEDADTQWNPRLGYRQQIAGGDWSWRASLGRAFKLPSFFALASPPALGGNPDLEPETAVGADLGLIRRSRLFRLSLTAFANRFKNLVDFDFETFAHVNRAEVEVVGGELEASFRPGPAWHLQANATWQQVEDVIGGQPLRHRPRWTGGLRADWQPSPQWGLHLDVQTVSRAYDQQIPVEDRLTTAGYTLYGFSGSWQVAQQWQLRARIANLSDKDYETLIGFPGPGRTIRLELKYKH